MARIRTVKPEFFDDPDVIDLTLAARLLFIGLWTQADRRGRLLDEPRRLKLRLMPCDNVDVNALIDELAKANLVVRYEGDGRNIIWIKNFERHQRPHAREAESVLSPYESAADPVPTPNKDGACTGPVTTKVVAGPPVTVSGSGKGTVPVTVSGLGKAGAKTPAAHAPGPAPIASGPHRAHASCGRVCVPAFVHEELRRQLGGTEDDADRRLREWYGLVLDGLPDDAVIAVEAVRFWREHFREWQAPATAPRRPRLRRAVLPRP